MARDVALAVKMWDSCAANFGGVLSKAKCSLSANTPHAANKLKAATTGEGIPVVKEAKDLGAPSTGGGARRTGITKDRMRSAADRAKRLKNRPGRQPTRKG